MVTTEDLGIIVSTIETHLVSYASSEIDGYKYGSYFIPKNYNNSVKHLDLYLFILQHIYDISSVGLDYTDFGFDDSNVNLIINNASELMFYYG